MGKRTIGIQQMFDSSRACINSCHIDLERFHWIEISASAPSIGVMSEILTVLFRLVGYLT